MIFEVQDQLEGLVLDVMSLKTTPGKHMMKFVQKLNVQDRMFGDISLKGQVVEVDWASDTNFQRLIDDTLRYLEKR
jgi:hypothetical protein